MDLPAPQQLPVTAQWCLEDRRCIALEVARTPLQQQIGLMQRPALPAAAGHVVSLRSPQALRFWMFNTLAPLDMLFLRGQPCDGDCGRCSGLSEAALPQLWRQTPVMGWWSCGSGRPDRLGIRPGDRVKIETISSQ